MSKPIVGRPDWPSDFTPSPRDDHGDFNIRTMTPSYREMFRKGTTHEYELSLYVGDREGIPASDLARGVYPIKNLDYFECIANRMVAWAKQERARLAATRFEIPQPDYADKPDSSENLEDFFNAVGRAIRTEKGEDWAIALNKSCGVEWTRLPNGTLDPEYPSGDSYWSNLYHRCEKGEKPPKEVVDAMKRLLTKYGRSWDEPRWAAESWKPLVNGLLTGDGKLVAQGMGGRCINWDTPLKIGDTRFSNGWSGLHAGLARGTTSLPDYVKEGLTNKALQFIAEGF